MPQLILLQLFWFSFVLIGQAGFWLLEDYYPAFKRKPIYKVISVLNPFSKAFVLFAASAGFFIPVVLVAYAIKAPITLLSSFYLVTLISALIIALKRYRTWHIYFKKPSLGFVLAFAVLLIDYLIALRAGGPIDGDAPTHIAKINLFLHGRISFADPYLGFNGVNNTRYSITLMGIFQASVAQMLRLSAMKVWLYSYAFYRLLAWASLFTLYQVFGQSFIKKHWSYLVLILLPIFYSGYFFNAVEVPHVQVVIWFALFAEGLKLLIERNSSMLLFVSALLIASTHIISALAAVSFLVLLAILLNYFRASNKKLNLRLALAVLILLIPILPLALQLSGPATPDGLLQNSGSPLHATSLKVHLKNSFILPTVPPILSIASNHYWLNDWVPIIAIIVFGFYLLLIKKLRSGLIKKIGTILIIIGALEVISYILYSLVGYIFLFKNSASKASKILIGLLVFYFALIAFNPVVLQLVFHRLPLWVLERFQDTNALAYIAPILGLLIVYEFILKFEGLKDWAKGYGVLLFIGLVAVLPVHNLPVSVHQLSDREIKDSNTVLLREIDRLTPLDNDLKDQVIYTDSLDVADYLAAVTTGKYVGLPLNYTQLIRAKQSCAISVEQNLNLEDLQAAQITRLVINANDYQLINLADSKPYLALIDQTPHFKIYSVPVVATSVAASVDCTVPYGQ